MFAYGLARRPADRWDVLFGRLFRLGFATLLLLVLPAAAGAYTLVLRSGRHVTVPDDFKVTPAAVVYEASPGFSVTVWLSNVDFAATERANGEPAGSFVRRVAREPEGAVATPARAPEDVKRPARSVVTNKELEPLRLRREAQEEEYERTRRQRGMPSKQELRRRIEEQDRRLSELTRQMQEERREAELESLRSELMEARRELDELNLRLSQATTYVPAYAPSAYYPYLYAPPVQVITVLPFGHHGRFGHGGFGPQWPQHPWPDNSFPTMLNPFRGAGAQPQMMAPAMPAPRR